VRANNRKLTEVLNNLSAYCSGRGVMFSKMCVKTDDCSTVLLADDNLIVQKIANKVAVLARLSYTNSIVNKRNPNPKLTLTPLQF
jgi:hypothetical protein